MSSSGARDGAASARSAAVMTWLALAAFGVLGVALILLFGPYYGYDHVAMSWDTAYYISAARNLVAGDGFVVWNGAHYKDPAPLFPLLLAAVGLFGIDALDAAHYVNAAAFGLTVFAAAAWLKRRVRSPLLAVWAGCACALMLRLIYAAASLLTESSFILFTVVSLSLLDRFLSSGRRRHLLLAAAAAAAACLTRSIGASLIVSGALILLLRNDFGTRARLRDSALWSVVSLAPVGLWMVRILLVFGSPLPAALTADGWGYGFSGLMSLHRATGEFGLWLFGPTGFDLLTRAIGSVMGIDLAASNQRWAPSAAVPAIAAKSAILAAPALGAGYALARYRPGFLRANRAVLTVAVAFTTAYSLSLVVLLPRSELTLPVRYLVPLFPPLLVVATLVLDGIIAKDSFTNAAAAKRFGAAAAAVPVAVAIVMSLWLAGQAGATYRTVKARLNDIPGWMESGVLRYLRANRLDGDVWASHPPMLYLHTDLHRVSSLNLYLAEVTDRLANGNFDQSLYIVLFQWSLRNHDYGADDLAALPELELVADLDDGWILHRRPAIPASSAEAQVVRAYFDIHVYDDAFAYFKEPCTDADVAADFFLHVVPVDGADLSTAARAEGAFFNRLDFSFAERGIILDGRCLAVVVLPDYRISHLETGQYSSASGQLWNAAIDEQWLRLIPYWTAYRSVRAGDYGTAKVRSTFDLYLDAAERTLTYLREPCTADDVSDPFFLHVQPASPADLLDRLSRSQSGEHLDFSFTERGVLLDGACVAIAALPDYEIARIRTGQYVSGEGNSWEVEYAP